jgi:hypothetical protein
MRSRIVALAATVTAGIIMLTACNIGPSTTAAAPTSSTTTTSQVPDRESVHTINPESNDSVKAPVVRRADNKLACDPNVNSQLLTLDANGMSEGLEGQVVQVTPYDGFTRFEWNKNTGKVAAIIVNGSLYGLVKQPGWVPQTGTNLDDKDWDGKAANATITICGLPKM